MVPEFSIIYPILWSDTSKNEINAILKSLNDTHLHSKKTEIIIVICHITTDELTDAYYIEKNSITGQNNEYTIRFYNIQTLNLEEGETLGTWLAFGHTLIIPYRHNPVSDNGLITYTPFTGRFLEDNNIKICDDNVYLFDDVGCWAITKRTYWDACVYRMHNEWPASLTVHHYRIDSYSRIDSRTHEYEYKNDKEIHKQIEQSTETVQDNSIIKLNMLYRSPLPFEESFISYEYRQWNWRHMYTVSSKMNKPHAVYSTVFGYCDPICHDITRMVDNAADSLFFTDVKWPRHYKGWTIVYMPNIFMFQKTCRDPPQTMSRITKLMPCEFLSMYTSTLYIDNNIIIKHNVSKLIRDMLKKKEWGVPRHGKRNCAYKEIKKCIDIRKDDPKYLHMQETAYRRAGLPRFAGLAECPVISRMNIRRVAGICRQWWIETNKYSKRDQISFAFVAWKHKYWQHINLLNSVILSKTNNSLCWVYKGGKALKNSNTKVASRHKIPVNSVQYTESKGMNSSQNMKERIESLKRVLRQKKIYNNNEKIMKLFNKLSF